VFVLDGFKFNTSVFHLQGSIGFQLVVSGENINILTCQFLISQIYFFIRKRRQDFRLFWLCNYRLIIGLSKEHNGHMYVNLFLPGNSFIVFITQRISLSFFERGKKSFEHKFNKYNKSIKYFKNRLNTTKI